MTTDKIDVTLIKREIKHIEIDIVKEFNCPSQSDEYNSSYRKWLKQPNNSFGYNYRYSSKENVYIDGVGLVNEYPQLVEARVIKKVSMLFGVVLILLTLLHILIPVFVNSLLGGNAVDYDIYEGYNVINKSGLLYLIIDVILIIFNYGIPITVALYFLRMPKCVTMPIKSKQNNLVLLSIPIMLWITIISNYLNDFFCRILSFFKFNAVSNYDIKINDVDTSIVPYIISLIVSIILYNILFRGILLQCLRQFGDRFAILVIAIITAVVAHDIANIINIFIISICLNYLVIKSGSILAGMIPQIMIRIIMTIPYLLHDLSYFKDNPHHIPILKVIIIIIGMLSAFMFVARNRYDFDFKNVPTALSLRAKLINTFSNVPAIMFVIISFVLCVVSAVN